MTCTVTFTLDDPDHRLAGVRLEQEIGIPGDALEFRHEDGRWRLTLNAPPVRRIEYRLHLRHGDGRVETITDPANAKLAPGAFGHRSVLELPGYRPPAWLTVEGAAGTPARWPVAAHLDVATRVGVVEVTVLSPPVPTQRLVVAHDGPEYDQLANLGTFAAAAVADGRVPPFHLALAAPGARDERYSANPAYSDAFASTVSPALRSAIGVAPDTAGPAVLIGASLGGLAALHLQRRHPGAIAGLFLQSGSFLVPEFDECESNFRYYRRVIRYVASVHRAQRAAGPVPVVLTCGSVEHNVHNNRLMAATLRRQGYPAVLHELPDAHNYTAWRDAFDPHLVSLLRKAFADA